MSQTCHGRCLDVSRAAFEQRAQDVARLKEEAKQRAAAAQQVQELLRDRLYDCTTKQLIGLADSDESARCSRVLH